MRRSRIHLIGITVTLGTFLCLAPAFAQSGEKELFLVAQKAFEDGFYDVAMRYIQQLQEQYPQTQRHIESNILLGQCYFFKGQYLKSYEIFHELLKESSFKDATLFWLGETYLKGGDYSQAQEQYHQLIKFYADSPYTPQAYYSLGWVYFEQNHLEKSQQAFAELLQKFPHHQLVEEAHFKIGEIVFQRKDYQDVIKYFKGYIAQYPQSIHRAQAYFYMGESSYLSEDFLTAVTYYAKAAEMAYDHKFTVMAQLGLGWSYLKLERLKLAQQYFEEAYTLAHDQGILSEDVLLGRASLAIAMKDYEQALKAYAELIETLPHSNKMIDAYLGQANLYYLREDYPHAIQSYQDTIDRFTSNEGSTDMLDKAYFGLAWSYLKMGYIDTSVKYFEIIKDKTASKTVKISALAQIGDAYQDVGHPEKAIEVYDEILRDHPESVYTDYVQYRQGIALLKTERNDAAILSFRSLKTNFVNSRYLSDADYYLSLAYFKKGDWGAARDQIIQFIDQTSRDNPFMPEAYYIAALSYFNLQDYGNALKRFQSIIQIYPLETALIKNVEMGMARCYDKMGNVQEAIRRFVQIVTTYPQATIAQEALIWLGDHYLQQADYATAIGYYRKFIDDFPGSPRLSLVFYELGQAHQAKGEYSDALNFYQQIDNLAGGDLYARARLAIADIFAQELDTASAIATYRNIIAASSEFQRDAWGQLAEIYKKNGEYEKAIMAYQSALSASPGLGEWKDVALQFAIGDAYELLNKRDKALEEYLKISYLYPQETPWIVKAYLHVGRIFEDDEKWDEAKKIYQKITQLKTDELKFAQERVDWIDEHIFHTIKR